MSRQHLKVKSTSGLPGIIKHLDHIIQALKKGSLSITTSRDAIILRPQEPVSLELKAEVKLQKYAFREKLVLEMKWEKSTEPIRENVIFMIDHSLPQEAEDKAESKEKAEEERQKEVAEQRIPCADIPETTAIHDPLEISSQEESGGTIRKTSSAQKKRSAVRKPGRG